MPPIPKKPSASEKYTAADSAVAKEVVKMRAEKLSRGKSAMESYEKMSPVEKILFRREMEKDSRERALLNESERLSRTDTTMSKALKDVKASQRMPDPMDVDVRKAKMEMKKKKK